jgi:hypothetical protein
VLAILLATIAFAASARYRDLRFGCIGAALAVVGLVGLLGLLNGTWSDLVPAGSSDATVLVVLIAAEALLYLSLVLARPPRSVPAGG